MKTTRQLRGSLDRLDDLIPGPRPPAPTAPPAPPASARPESFAPVPTLSHYAAMILAELGSAAVERMDLQHRLARRGVPLYKHELERSLMHMAGGIRGGKPLVTIAREKAPRDSGRAAVAIIRATPDGRKALARAIELYARLGRAAGGES